MQGRHIMIVLERKGESKEASRMTMGSTQKHHLSIDIFMKVSMMSRNELSLSKERVLLPMIVPNDHAACALSSSFVDDSN